MLHEPQPLSLGRPSMIRRLMYVHTSSRSYNLQEVAFSTSSSRLRSSTSLADRTPKASLRSVPWNKPSSVCQPNFFSSICTYRSNSYGRNGGQAHKFLLMKALSHVDVLYEEIKVDFVPSNNVPFHTRPHRSAIPLCSLLPLPEEQRQPLLSRSSHVL